MTDDDLTERIIACAFKVHRALGPGFSEKVYENSMRVALNHERIKVKRQATIQVYFEGEIVGEFVPDLWVEDRVLVELKAILTLQREHEVQLVNYLTATGVETGLLINFGPSVEVRRKFRTYSQKLKGQFERRCCVGSTFQRSHPVNLVDLVKNSVALRVLQPHTSTSSTAELPEIVFVPENKPCRYRTETSRHGWKLPVG